ncbi:oocyte zinc finger -like [Pelobates cultripes]|uniref:Oocyte zinc finger -like n=1 Tax=Pelobates cultripes TaxID=61616 RepID=A0AAD1T7P1_PELCU|nr:oocyte zinc finger -like [Pelobates cultripes]
MMNKNRNRLSERILNITLKIIYLLTGEDYLVVKKHGDHDGLCSYQMSRFSRTQSPSTVPPPHSVIHERNNDRKILELTNEIIQLLTGEEWEYIEEKKEPFKTIVMEDLQPLSSLDLAALPPLSLSLSARSPASYPTRRSVSHTEHSQPDHVVVKKSSDCVLEGSDSTLGTVPPPRSLLQMRNNEQKVLELTNKIIHLLTGEVWQYLDGHKESHSDVILENRQPVSSLDLSKAKTSSVTFQTPISSPSNLNKEDCISESNSADFSTIYNPCSGNCKRDISDSFVHRVKGNFTDIEMYTASDHTQTEDPSTHIKDESASREERNLTDPDIYTPTEHTQTGYPFSNIKEDPASSEEGNITNIYKQTEYPSDTVNEEQASYEIGNLTETAIYRPAEQTQTEYTATNVNEEPVLCRERNLADTDIYTRAGHIKTEYTLAYTTEDSALLEEEIITEQTQTQDKQMASTTFCIPHVITYTREKSFEDSDCENSPSKNPQIAICKTVHTGQKAFSCPECEKCFSSKSILESHQRVHTGEKPFSCSECEKSFCFKPHLVKHQKIHTGFKPYTCTVCGKHFAEKGSLSSHLRVHTGDKPYACTECGKLFQTQSNLSRHRHIHEGQKPYSCSECGKHFAHKSYLKQHFRMHIGGKPYLCTECGKGFQYQTNLIRHRRIHTGEKPYCCTECGRCFRQKAHLEIHQTQHTGNRPYSCSECLKCFTRKSHLLVHQKIHLQLKQ